MAIRNKEFYERQNRILEKMASIDLQGSNNRYCWALFRKTFGFGKYEDRVSRSQMSILTGMLEVNVSRAKRELKEGLIIFCNGKIQGFNLNIDQWKKVSTQIPNKKVSTQIQKGIYKAEKKGIYTDTYKETTKKLTKEGGGVLKKLGIRAVEKLEGKKWLRQVMWQRYNFKEEFINKIFKAYSFMQCYNAYLVFEEATDVRSKEAWILAKLERSQEEE